MRWVDRILGTGNGTVSDASCEPNTTARQKVAISLSEPEWWAVYGALCEDLAHLHPQATLALAYESICGQITAALRPQEHR